MGQRLVSVPSRRPASDKIRPFVSFRHAWRDMRGLNKNLTPPSLELKKNENPKRSSDYSPIVQIIPQIKLLQHTQ